MVPVAARDELLAFTLRAFINRHVAETLNKSTVNPLQSFTAQPALHAHVCYNSICGSGTSRATIKDTARPSHFTFYAGPHYRAWRAPAQSQEHRCRDPPQHAHGDHRTQRIGQIFAGFRYDLRRGPAALRGDALHLRAAIPGSDGAPRRGFHRRVEPRDRKSVV